MYTIQIYYKLKHFMYSSIPIKEKTDKVPLPPRVRCDLLTYVHMKNAILNCEKLK